MRQLTKNGRQARFGRTPDWAERSTSHWRQAAVGLMSKRSADGDSVQFEQAFANLAHSALRDAAAKLLDYEIGFQLIEKNKDNSRAVGVFGFQLSGQWLYAPVFFLNGEMKGNELLYVKSQSLFVPLSDDWVNYLLGHRPPMLGDEVDRNSANLGIRTPDLQRLIRSPYKTAAAGISGIPDWLAGFIEDLPALALTKLSSQQLSPWPLSQAIKDMGQQAAIYLRDVIGNAYPQIKAGFARFYGDTLLDTLASPVQSSGIDLLLEGRRGSRPGVSILKQGFATGGNVDDKIVVVTRHDVLDGSGEIPLGAERRFDAVEQGIAVDDRRSDEDVSKVYRENHPLNTFHPDSTGVYRVFLHPNKFVEHLVVTKAMGRTGRAQRGARCLVMDLDTKAWQCADSSQLVCCERWSDDKFQEWLSQQPKVTPAKLKGPAFLLDQYGTGTEVFRTATTFGGDGNVGQASGLHWIGSYFSGTEHLASGYEQTPDVGRERQGPVDPARPELNEIVIRETTATIDTLGDTLYVPHTARCIAVDAEASAMPFGTVKDIFHAIAAGGDWMSVHRGEFGVSIAGKGYRDKNAALKHLIVDWGLREAAAREILQDVEGAGFSTLRYVVKRAYVPDLVREAPSADMLPEPPSNTDSFMGTGMPVEIPYIRGHRLGATSAATYKPGPRLPDPDTLASAQQAAIKGEKQLFDTRVFQSMLAANQFDTIIGRKLGDLLKGMHSKGCIYFQFLWHGDAFKKRYGAEELPEIEDGLRSAFAADGKLILALKRRSVEPSAVDGIRHDLGSLD